MRYASKWQAGIISVVIGICIAPSGQAEDWSIGGEKVGFILSSPVPVANCGKKGKSADCAALAAARTKVKPESPSGADRGGGANPAAEFCAQRGGRVVIGFDSMKNENSFCRFKDGSLVSTADLYDASAEN